jgi:RNA polymerase sigma factor FliA
VDPAHELFEQYENYGKAIAHTFAKRLASKRVSTENIVQWGLAGLYEAARRFNPESSVTFETFAYYRIRGAIHDELRKLSLTPRTRRKAAEQRGQDEYLQSEVPDFDPRLSDAEQASRVRDAIRGLGAVFLASQLATEDGEDPLAQVAAEEEPDEPSNRELIAKTRAAVAKLPERQRVVLQAFYVEHRSMSELATTLGVNKATVSREHSRAVSALREALGIADT